MQKLHNFIHIISMQSNGAAITLPGSGSSQICQRISGHSSSGQILKNLNTVLMSMVYRTHLLWSGVGLVLYHWHYHGWRYHSNEVANLLCFHNGLMWDPALLTIYKARCRYCQMSNLILLENVSREPLHFVVSPYDSQKAQYTFNQKVQYTFQVRTCSVHS